jgi:hypothetical protein
MPVCTAAATATMYTWLYSLLQWCVVQCTYALKHTHASVSLSLLLSAHAYYCYICPTVPDNANAVCIAVTNQLQNFLTQAVLLLLLLL